MVVMQITVTVIQLMAKPDLRFAENNGTARTQAGELSQADKEKVSQVMNETGLLFQLGIKVALEGIFFK